MITVFAEVNLFLIHFLFIQDYLHVTNHQHISLKFKTFLSIENRYTTFTEKPITLI